jgi:hypothetical protein
MALGGAVVVAGLVACSSAPVAPRVEMIDGFHGPRPATIYVIPERDAAAIQASLEKAGFTVTPEASSAAYLLRVAVGAKRATTPCGTVNNVRYQLGSGSEAGTDPRHSWRVLEIKARGPTGSCQPNVYDEMSAALRASFPPDPAP